MALVCILVAAIALQAFGLAQTVPALALALVVGAVAAVAYVRLRAARSFLSVLAPAPLVFLVVFLALSDVSPLVFGGDGDVRAADVAARAPVVLVILDELPLNSVLDERERIHARRYPNLARLARQATLYRNTTTVHADTPYAVPAILDGNLPREDRLPVAADHPRSLFSLLGDDYALHVQEDATAVCARELCRDSQPGFPRRMRALWDDLTLVYLHQLLPDELERRLPSVTETWGEFRGDSQPADATRAAERVEQVEAKRRETRGQRKRRLIGNLHKGRPGRFESFVQGIRGGPRPRLHVLHTLLPHVPFQYLPSGRSYRERAQEELPGLNSSTGFHVQWLVEQGWQRHLLQAGATDRLLGRLFDRLRRLGVYDRALIAVVADHGASFQRGFDRRYVRPGNIQDIAPVPFLLKAPGQRRARISDKPLRTTDVLPTIADVLDIRIPWRVDGRSALRPTAAGQRRRRVIGKRFGYSVPVDGPGYLAARRATLRRQLALFGGGLHSIGPRRDLIGRGVRELAVAPRSRPVAGFIGADRYRRVEPGSGFVPVHVVGTLRGGTRGGGKQVALAVNGRVAATGHTFSLGDRHEEHFAVFLPESALRPGANRLELLWIRGRAAFQRLGETG